ncbi:DUF1853 family protein [uncultured Marixanthomonas sp.]|uniref:DUF1853 family protein n=1 Tax=uncultured Marixanthomonas sp. TaxID=757245 RepID=UPI0030DCD352|tara:strand:- start:46224 stop:47114 length:891 start_codon:yes stop_codon:yes gene_type:complete
MGLRYTPPTVGALRHRKTLNIPYNKKAILIKNTLDYFIKAPDLKAVSGTFPFSFFSFSEEGIDTSQFQFTSNLMLGKQAEACFEYVLKHAKRYKLLTANIQIQGETQTLGELDYLIYDTETQKTLHIELACKFYLFDDSLGAVPEAKWIGPNRKDTLQEKLDKVKEKQFPLLYKPETADFLKDLHLDIATIEQQICIKSFLFLPKDFDKEKLPRQYQECVVGTYISFSKFDTEKSNDAQFAIPDKKQWLLPPESLTEWFSFSETKEKIASLVTNKKSPLVYKKQKGILEKFFVVWW